MKKIPLALLCSSGFFVLVSLTANPAWAKKVTPQDLAYPRTTSDRTQQINAPVVKQDSEYPTLNSTETEKELAVQRLGCDCPGCQARASQMPLQGTFPQPK